MRKHPLIALIAFTTLGAGVAAGITAGSSHSVLTSAKTVAPRGLGPIAAPPVSQTTLESVIWLPNRLDLNQLTGRRVQHVIVPAAAPRPRPATQTAATPTSVPPAAPQETTAPVSPPTTSPPAEPQSAAAPAGGVWSELRQCESGGDYATNTGNGYYGAYQFALSTWYGLGFTGLPSDAPPAVQDQAARELQARSGWGQWPACAAKLGLY